MARYKVKAVDADKNELLFRDVQDASKYIKETSKMEEWKIQLYIAYALCKKGNAFKHRWFPNE